MTDRFPGFDVLAQSGRWDPVTAGVVLARTAKAPDIRFFTPSEEAIATALVDQLLGQQDRPLVPVAPQIDARLAETQTDGWHYDDMPADAQAWRDTLADLDADTTARFGTGFATCSPALQAEILQAVQDLGSNDWRGRSAAHAWSLWTRYACTAFYSHPLAWNEIGFAGPAYPRGYKNLGVDSLERHEVRDRLPTADPIRRSQR
ncbi:gluconate 2-dehydrogenase subunit 3 family protein [Antrihabitans cavernicola]|uniref:Gluconate 2-dehydrogenase subunit 3 family protein n=1 Tax=Antrihabitans cavernicola TaxID=2495913 RepID=A0A5A7S568_9NOCA|nr:gluconate 2-dehydrogenase subunit 3 family protein [Spelaeibacter cavernicola]KAA0016572.1 gluconate 2-dehydrogenase subunit 3 family protein [Spelaeibacter cavernicola]